MIPQQSALGRMVCALVAVFLLARSLAHAACPFSSASTPQVRIECVVFEDHQYLVASTHAGPGIRIVAVTTNHRASLKDLSGKDLPEKDLPPGASPVLVTNAGIFADNSDGSSSPQGLLIHDGIEKHKLNLHSLTGPNITNFYWKPNGVFWIDTSGKTHITESQEFSKVDPKLVTEATQSGPLLLQGGEIHPDPATGKPSEAFLASKSSYIRNGVGVGNPSNLFVVISLEPVHMAEFARLFRDKLLCTDALYLDGAISDMYLPGIDKFAINQENGSQNQAFDTFLAVLPGK